MDIQGPQVNVEAAELRNELTNPASDSDSLSSLQQPHRFRLLLVWGGLAVLGLALAVTVFIALTRKPASIAPVLGSAFDTTQLPLDKLTLPPAPAASTLTVNGKLQANASIVLTPSIQPNAPVTGEFYYDQAANNLTYYNGSQFVNLVGGSVIQNTTNLTTINNISSGPTASPTALSGVGPAGSLVKFTGTHTVGPAIASDDGSTLTVNGGVNLVSNGQPGADITAFSASDTPTTLNNPDPKSVELGVKFRTDVSGFIRGIRFYKGNLNVAGTHVGDLWSSSGALLASATFTTETASGWQEVHFSTPVAVSADTVYVASYHTNSGFYSSTNDYFTSQGVTNGSLHLLQNGDDGANGVFSYAAGAIFPTHGFKSDNYWVDVVFAPNAPPNRYQVNGVQISSSDLSNNTDLAKRSASQTFTGTNTFRDSFDSTSNFSIQAAAGTSMFTIDATDNLVVIGQPGGNAAGTLLVLGNKGTVGDPAGVEGAMYYNGASSSLRCFRFGAWDNCADLEVDHGFSLYDEFMGGQTTILNGSTSISSLGWSAQAIGANGSLSFNPTTPAPSSDRPGVLQLHTPAVSNEGTTLNLGSFLLASDNIMKTAVAVGATSGQVLRVGLDTETTSVTQPLSGVWWEDNPAADTHWLFCYGDGTTATCASSNILVAANTWATLEIRITATGTGTSAVSFVNDGIFFNLANITIDTTNQVAPAYTCYTTTAAAQTCSWDYFQLKGTTLVKR